MAVRTTVDIPEPLYERLRHTAERSGKNRVRRNVPSALLFGNTVCVPDADSAVPTRTHTWTTPFHLTNHADVILVDSACDLVDTEGVGAGAKRDGLAPALGRALGRKPRAREATAFTMVRLVALSES